MILGSEPREEVSEFCHTPFAQTPNKVLFLFLSFLFLSFFLSFFRSSVTFPDFTLFFIIFFILFSSAVFPIFILEEL